MEPAEPTALKKRTTVVLPVDLLVEIDKLRLELGLTRSSLLVLAAAFFIAQSAQMIKPARRAESLAAIRQIFDKLAKDADKSA